MTFPVVDASRSLATAGPDTNSWILLGVLKRQDLTFPVEDYPLSLAAGGREKLNRDFDLGNDLTD